MSVGRQQITKKIFSTSPLLYFVYGKQCVGFSLVEKNQQIQCYNVANVDYTIITIIIYSHLCSTSKHIFQLDVSVMVAEEKLRPSQRKWPKVTVGLRQFRLPKLDRLKCIYQTTGLTSLSLLITSMSRYTRLLRNDERFKTTVRVNVVVGMENRLVNQSHLSSIIDLFLFFRPNLYTFNIVLPSVLYIISIITKLVQQIINKCGCC